MRSRLRTYSPMRRQSLKVRKAQPDFQKVYRLVDLRSEGFCEVHVIGGQEFHPAAVVLPITKCPRRATDHHHLLKPRRSHHEPGFVIHVCREHHDRMQWPYKRGRLVWVHDFYFTIRYAADKFAALIRPRLAVYQPKAAP